MKRNSISLVIAAIALVSCTKKNDMNSSTSAANHVDMANAISPNEGDTVILESSIDVSKKYVAKLHKDDIFVWDVKNKEGQVIALNVDLVPKFPTKVVVRAKNLLQPLPKDSGLIFSARIMRPDDRSQPPKKGQLALNIGMDNSNTKMEGKSGVSEQVIEKFMKKQNLSQGQLLSVGAKVKGQLEPLTF